MPCMCFGGASKSDWYPATTSVLGSFFCCSFFFFKHGSLQVMGSPGAVLSRRLRELPSVWGRCASQVVECVNVECVGALGLARAAHVQERVVAHGGDGGADPEGQKVGVAHPLDATRQALPFLLKAERSVVTIIVDCLGGGLV